jgi:uncharacterized damage-inducible protein DinB
MDGESEQGRREVLRPLWEHHWWSVDLLFREARGLSAEEFGRGLDISYGSFHGALAHLVGSEQVWAERVRRGGALAKIPGVWEMPGLGAVEAVWVRCKQDWRAVFARDDFERVVSYRNTKGEEFEDPLWLILAHLVDHGAAYRGTLVAALRLLGRTPPTTGLIFYTRQKGSGF